MANAHKNFLDIRKLRERVSALEEQNAVLLHELKALAQKPKRRKKKDKDDE